MMDSTPDQPVPSPEEPREDSVDTPEPVVPPTDEPTDAPPPGTASVAGESGTPAPDPGTPPPPPPGHPPADPHAGPPVPPPGHPGQWQPGPWQQPGQPGAPGQPGPWQPGQPGQWQQAPGQPGPMGYTPRWGTPPAPARRRLGFGAGLAIGIGIGIVAHILGVLAMFAVLNALNGDAGIIGLVWPFLLIAVAAIVMMFFPATRSYATGILIIAAAMWLVIIGPCIVLLGGFS